MESGGDGELTLVGGPVGSERAEGDGVAAALGGEVAAEPEHVRPGGQPHFLDLRDLAQAQACGNMASGVGVFTTLSPRSTALPALTLTGPTPEASTNGSAQPSNCPRIGANPDRD